MTQLVQYTCPYLGLATDPDQSSQVPSAQHRCYASEPPALPNLIHQGICCLTTNCKLCPLYPSAESIAERTPDRSGQCPNDHAPSRIKGQPV